MKRTVGLACFVLSVVLGYGQRYYFKNYGLEEGVPQSHVKTILQDSRGYLWIGTDGGGARFDGIQFKEFTTREGLINNRITSIEEDQYGNIWFGTRAGVTVYTAQVVTPRFIHLTTEDGLVHEDVWVVQQGPDHQMFLGTEKGLQKVDLSATDNPFLKDSTQRHIQLDPVSKIARDKTIRDLVVDQESVYWIGTYQGLIRYEPTTQKEVLLTKENGLSATPIRHITRDGNGNIWCGTDKGLSVLITNESDSLRSIQKIYKLNGISLKRIFAIHSGHNDELWISFRSHLAQWKRSDTSSLGYRFVEIVSNHNGLKVVPVKSIYQDREGNWWFGGSSRGINKFRGKKFEAYNTTFGLAGDEVRGITKDDNGHLWVGTNKGVSKIRPDYSKKTIRQPTYFETYRSDKGMKATSVWSILHDSWGNLWVGGAGGSGIYRYDGHRFQDFTKDHPDFVGRAVMKMYEDQKGNIWMLTFRGTNVYHPVADTISRPFQKGEPFFKKRLTAIHHDKNGQFWFGTRDGLYRYHQQKMTHYTTADGLVNNYILSIKPDKKGNLWLATGKGVVRYDQKTFINYTTDSGLYSDTPYLLQFDEEGNLWVGTNKGVDKLVLDENQKVQRIDHYGKSEGFLGIETNANASYLDEEGQLWFGTMGGVVKYNQSEDHRNTTPPLVHLQELQVHYHSHPMKPGLTLSHTQDRLTFHYTGLSMTTPERVRYKFKLEGYEQEWSPLTDQQFVNYSNLPPGHYTFEVKARNGDGFWSREPATYSFTIQPPFWQTWWFLTITGIVILGGLWGGYRWRVRVLKQRQRELESKVEVRTEEVVAQKEEIEQQKEKIEEQKSVVEAKNKDITDSITYAKRIQQAILPDPNQLPRLFSEAFVLYIPRDIVSGDFYWYTQIDGRIVLILADCTGHSVPGALMSMIGTNVLNHLIEDEHIIQPSEILYRMNQRVTAILHRETEKGETPDGMDMACCVIRPNQQKLLFSGAQRPLLMVRDDEVKEFAGERISIGGYGGGESEFEQQEVRIQKGDSLYLYSDGYPDQFGGPADKKFLPKRFRKLLQEISTQPLEVQRQVLYERYQEWKGDQEQIDDISVIGVRV